MDSASSCIIVNWRTPWEFNVRIIIGVPTLFGKSWNCVCKISGTWNIVENEFGSRKSWNLLGNDADAVTKMSASAHLCSLSEHFCCCFFATCDSDDEHTCISSMDAAIILCIYIWLVTVVCL